MERALGRLTVNAEATDGEGVPLRFACDAMLRGLARWLRACGYDATWTYGIDDEQLLDEAQAQGRVVLTADGGILRSGRVLRRAPRALAVPNELPPVEQARLVLATEGLRLRAPRCMACGGALDPVDKADVEGEAPPRTFAAVDRYDRCRRCGKLLWKGSHWRSIDAQLAALASDLGRER